MQSTWTPPEDWLKFRTIEAHTGGEPLRVIAEGWPDLPGDTILAKRSYARRHHDDLRRALMWEPRGHADMYGCIVTPPVTGDGHFGVLFLHNEGFSTMCGHGIIAIVKVALEANLVELGETGSRRELRIDSPAGRITAFAEMEAGGRVGEVSFLNVPSFLLESGREVDVQDVGPVVCDIAYGGAFYAYTDASALGLDLVADEYSRIVALAKAIKSAVNDQVDIRHPEGDADLNFLYGVIFTGPAESCHSRNVCVFAAGEVDRSPTGTGISGRAAIHFSRGDLALDQEITIESLIGTKFRVSVETETRVGSLKAVIPRVTGRAFVTGTSRMWIDPSDPVASGFLLR